MSSIIPGSPSPLAVRDDQVALLIIGRDLSRGSRDRLRRRGEWPPNFYVGSTSFVLLKDIEQFLARRVEAAETDRERFSERGKRAVAVSVTVKREKAAARARAAFDADGDGGEAA